MNRVLISSIFAVVLIAFLFIAFGSWSFVQAQGTDTPTPFPTETLQPTSTPLPTPFTMDASVQVAAATIPTQAFVFMLGGLVALAIARLFLARFWTKI